MRSRIKHCRQLIFTAIFGLSWTFAHAAITPPTIANNVFASTPVGTPETATVKLVLASADTISSIAIKSGSSGEYSVTSIAGCTMDGVTLNPVGTECDVAVKFTPIRPGSTASAATSRNATLLFTDGSGNVFAYGLAGAATSAIGHVTPGTISLFAGAALTGANALDNGLGSVTGGSGGDGGPATSALFDFYGGVVLDIGQNGGQPMAFDSAGNLYVIDAANYVIRKIDRTPSHIVTTVAGIAKSSGTSGNGGLATAAKLSSPSSLALDTAGDMYFLDVDAAGYQIIRRIDAVSGIITAIAGQNFTGTYNTASGGGTCTYTTIYSLAAHTCGDGGLASYAWLNTVFSLAIDVSGNLYMWSQPGGGYAQIREINVSTGIISNFLSNSVLGNPEVAGGMTLAADGNFYLVVINGNMAQIDKYNPASQALTILAGNDTNSGNNCTATTAQAGYPATNLYIAGNVGGASPSSEDLASDASGNIYLSSGLCNGDGYTYESPAIWRINLASGYAYLEQLGSTSNQGNATSGYNAYYSYGVAPFTAIPDNGGNIYFTTYNQIALLSGSTAALNYTSMYDYLTSPAQTVTYADVGNANAQKLSYNLATGTNFIEASTGDASACDAVTNVTAGGTCDIDIAFTPNAVGTLSDVLSATSTGGGSGDLSTGTQMVDLTGVGVAAARFAISPATLAFGNQAVNTTSAPMTFTLSNTGTAALGLSSFFPQPEFAEFTVTGGTCMASSSSLAAGASCTVTITFTPPSAIAYSGTFYVSDSVAFGTVANITGTGTPASAPQATLNPATLTFPGTTVNTSAATLPLTLANPGTSALAISSISVAGNNATSFSQTNNCGTSLAAGASCTITVTFTPTAASSGLTSSISVADNATGSPQTATLTGNGIATAPQAVLSPTTLSFPNTVVGASSASMPITLSNPGNAVLTISGLSIIGAYPGSFSQTNNCGTSLAVGATCTINVLFAPTTAGVGNPLTAAIYVTDNATSSPQSATLTGTGVAAAPQAVLSPTSLAFPSTTVGASSASVPMTLSNPGTSALAIFSIAFTGAYPGSFSQTNNCGTSLAVGASCTINVTFTPGSAAVLSASISVADNAANSPQTATLTGTGAAAPTPQAVLSPTALTFPSTTVGASSASMPITLSNPGTAALAISSISAAGANASSFSETNTCGTSLAAAASCTINVTFTPGSAAAFSAGILVTDNAAGSPQAAALAGTGTAAAAPQATLSPTSIAFPTLTVGTSSVAVPVTLSNPGTASLAISSIAVTGANANSFSETNTCGTSLAAAASCIINVTFTPGSAAALSASVSVTDNSAGSPQTATLTGTGIAVVTAGTFTVASSTPSATVQPGAAAQFNLTVAPLGGSFNNLVALSATGLPAGAQVSFLPGSVTPGATGAPSVMTIQTSTGLAVLDLPDQLPHTPVPLLAIFAGVPILGLAGSLRRFGRANRRWMLIALAALAILPTLALTGCGGGYFSPASRTYTVNVIGTSGSLQESTTISLTVQ